MTTLMFAALLTMGSTPLQDAYLYKVTLVRAAPGELLTVLDLYHRQLTSYDAAGDERPLIIRHSQGDQWDLMVILPVESMGVYYDAQRIERRRKAVGAGGLTASQFEGRIRTLVAWREETYFSGPQLEELRRTFEGANYFHIEMFVALAGKRDELYREREMENEYLRRLGRAPNYLFSKTGGAAWDVMTIGSYRGIKHFSESADVPPQRQEEAAIAAGFEGASRIGTYLRALIARHNDTLGTKVTW